MKSLMGNTDGNNNNGPSQSHLKRSQYGRAPSSTESSKTPVKREIGEPSLGKKHYPTRVMINLDENCSRSKLIPPKILTSSLETLQSTS